MGKNPDDAFFEGYEQGIEKGLARGRAEAAHAVKAAILHVAQVAEAVAWQAGVGASETAGMIISCLAGKPELIDRFLAEGSGLMISGEIGPENGCLTFHRMDGKVTTPEELRMAKDARRMLIDAGAKPPRPRSCR